MKKPLNVRHASQTVTPLAPLVAKALLAGLAAVRQSIEATGAELMLLPPSSPDLNQIEVAFSTLKALLRKAAERTVGALWDRIGQVLDAFIQWSAQTTSATTATRQVNRRTH